MSSIQMSVLNGLGDDEDAINGDLNDLFPNITFSNATVIEFDFIPSSSNISFRFLMASEEYEGDYACTYSDGFAFLLRDLTTNIVTNIAVVPETSSPIAITNIHPDIYNVNGNLECNAINETYFEGYNTPYGNITDTNFDGRTKVMEATATVVRNRSYRIKLVVADAIDKILDSAIFLEAGSFDLGFGLGEDVITCESSFLLDANVENATYKWFKDNIEIIGETNQTYNANLGTGIYKVEVTVSNGCVFEDEIRITFSTVSINEVITTFYVCDDDNDGLVTVNLISKNTEILDGQNEDDYDVVYFSDDQYLNQITNSSSYLTSDSTIYVQVQQGLNCIAQSSFEIELLYIQINNNISDLNICNDNNTASFFDLTNKQAEILEGLNINDYQIHYYTDSNLIDEINNPNEFESTGQIIYVQVVDNAFPYCTAQSSFELNSISITINNNIQTIYECDVDGFAIFDLTSKQFEILEGQNPNNYQVHYFTDAAFLNEIIDVSEFESSGQTIYVQVIDNSLLSCSVDSNFNISLHEKPVIGLTPLVSCSGIFDLTDSVGSDLYPNLTYEFYHTQTDLNNNESEIIETTNFMINSSLQTIFVKVVNMDTFCYSIEELSLSKGVCYPIIPEILTPNQILNNTFLIRNLRDGFIKFELKIYNRYGSLIYSGNINNEDWDGTYNGSFEKTPYIFWALVYNCVDNSI